MIIFAPPSSAQVGVAGNCFGLSLPVVRLGAWRCMASSEIYDPCFGAADAREVICVRNPAEPDAAIRMELLSRACENAVLGNVFCSITEVPPLPEPRPWAFRLPSGAVCVLLQGTVGQYQGELVPYSCDDGTTIIGFPTDGAVWTVEAVVRDGPRTSVPLVTVWQ